MVTSPFCTNQTQSLAYWCASDPLDTNVHTPGVSFEPLCSPSVCTPDGVVHCIKIKCPTKYLRLRVLPLVLLAREDLALSPRSFSPNPCTISSREDTLANHDKRTVTQSPYLTGPLRYKRRWPPPPRELHHPRYLLRCCVKGYL